MSKRSIIRARTVDAAGQIRMEDTIGTFEPGKRTELDVLDRDPFLSDTFAKYGIEVDVTISNGRLL